mmetsp:Transcript_7735/g.29002  ORF Transcript_7735/g.29002 Transcript_7735/m.29002 type:complete len:273 (+) Transcript_7735:687-1505(+)
MPCALCVCARRSTTSTNNTKSTWSVPCAMLCSHTQPSRNVSQSQSMKTTSHSPSKTLLTMTQTLSTAPPASIPSNLCLSPGTRSSKCSRRETSPSRRRTFTESKTDSGVGSVTLSFAPGANTYLTTTTLHAPNTSATSRPTSVGSVTMALQIPQSTHTHILTLWCAIRTIAMRKPRLCAQKDTPNATIRAMVSGTKPNACPVCGVQVPKAQSVRIPRIFATFATWRNCTRHRAFSWSVIIFFILPASRERFRPDILEPASHLDSSNAHCARS